MVRCNRYSLYFRLLRFSLLIYLGTGGTLSAQYNPDVIKAVYLERITRFIEWPVTNSERDSTVFIIGIYEEAEFFNSLTEIFKDKTIKGKKVSVIKITGVDQVKSCDICYLSVKGKTAINKFVSEANRNGVLLMSETGDFGEKGVHINFYLEDEKLKFEINKQSIDSGKFKISSLLLKSSKIIQPD
jgi:hypothetical protein